MLSILALAAVTFIFLYALRDPGYQEAAPNLRDGRLDLAGINLHDNGIILLNGGWDFYWLELLEKEDFASGVLPDPVAAKVPAVCNGFELNGKNQPGFVYGTYRLKG